MARGLALVLACWLVTACGAPGPDVDTLSREPILTPPVEAVELGRSSVDGGASLDLGLGEGVTAALQVAYAVDLTPEQAAQTWAEAYGR